MDRLPTQAQAFGRKQPFLYNPDQRHDHRRRVIVFWLGEWEVLMHPPCSDLHRLLVVNGMFHLQLWHPQSRTSILTPSAFTKGMFEINSLFGSEYTSRVYGELPPILHAAKRVHAPIPERVSDVFFGLFSEFGWRLPNAVSPPILRFTDEAVADAG